MLLETLIPAAVTLISQLIKSTSLTSPIINTAVEVITAVTPTVIQEYKSLKPIVKNIITVLKSDPTTHMDQLAALEEAEIKIDADFEAEAARAIAEDKEV